MIEASKVLITQSSYWPWRGYFDNIALADQVLLLENVQYTKRDWRNRNRIKLANGVKWITVPVKSKGAYHQLIDEVKIDDHHFIEKHLESIRHAYSQAAAFDLVFPHIENLMQSFKSTQQLSEINQKLIQWVCNYLEIKTPINNAPEGLSEDPTDRLIELVKQQKAQIYLSGPSAKDYLREEAFLKEGIELQYIDYADYPEYPQLHGNFVSQLSILDLLLNTGKNACQYLKHCP